MEFRLNKTPVRTCRNFKINDVVIDDIKFTENIEKFENIHILGLNENVEASYEVNQEKLKYGIGEEVEKEIFEYANHKIKLNIKKTAFIEIYNDFDKKNSKLIDLIDIECKKRSES
ncbi:MAG: hypothetical protein HFJ50_10005 [Clostridia bacterium]|jgi:hypothetical protein|nr:hypothetical protein [Clostridia bacterium]